MELHDIVVVGKLTTDITLAENGLNFVILGDMCLLKLLESELFAVAACQIY